MTKSYLQHQISTLHLKKAVVAIESIAVLVFSLYGTALLPQLLVQLMYGNQPTFVQPPVWLQYIPVAFFALGVSFFLYAVLTILGLARKSKKLETELEREMEQCTCVDLCESSDLAEMLETAEKVVEEAEKKTKTKSKSASKKSSKKK